MATVRHHTATASRAAGRAAGAMAGTGTLRCARPAGAHRCAAAAAMLPLIAARSIAIQWPPRAAAAAADVTAAAAPACP